MAAWSQNVPHLRGLPVEDGQRLSGSKYGNVIQEVSGGPLRYWGLKISSTRQTEVPSVAWEEE